MSPALARLYEVQAPDPDGWTSYHFDPTDHRAGIQSLIGFVALHAHPGRSSPTLRGKAVRELLMCQRIPDPPADVDFSKFNDPTGPTRTARERLIIHNDNPSCAGCHKLMDPIGLAMENFDGAGTFRADENGVSLDVSGDLDGMAFRDVDGFGQALTQSAATASCLVQRVFGYVAGRPATREDGPYLEAVTKKFEKSNFRFTDLVRAIIANEGLYRVGPAGASKASAASKASLAKEERPL